MKQRSRRTPEQQIADLQAKIAAIQERKERKKAMKDPALRHVASALRAVDNALKEATAPGMKERLKEAREQLAGCTGGLEDVLIPRSAGPGRPRKTPAVAEAEPDEVLRYLKNNPGARCEDVAGALGAESRAVSPVLKALKSEGRARTEGQARGMKYFAVAR